MNELMNWLNKKYPKDKRLAEEIYARITKKWPSISEATVLVEIDKAAANSFTLHTNYGEYNVAVPLQLLLASGEEKTSYTKVGYSPLTDQLFIRKV